MGMWKLSDNKKKFPPPFCGWAKKAIKIKESNKH